MLITNKKYTNIRNNTNTPTTGNVYSELWPAQEVVRPVRGQAVVEGNYSQLSTQLVVKTYGSLRNT